MKFVKLKEISELLKLKLNLLRNVFFKTPRIYTNINVLFINILKYK